MTPVASMARDGDALLTGQGQTIRVEIGPDGCARAVTIGGQSARIASPAQLNGEAGETCVTVPLDLPLKEAVALRQRGGTALLVVDHSGVLVGTACDHDIFRALLRE